jgi:hypothetical protein
MMWSANSCEDHSLSVLWPSGAKPGDGAAIESFGSASHAKDAAP